jgi:hypothetical protein
MRRGVRPDTGNLPVAVNLREGLMMKLGKPMHSSQGVRSTLVLALSIVAVVSVSGGSAVWAACSHDKLALDYCGAAPAPTPNSAPLYKPTFDKPAPSPLPNTHPTVVCGYDSRGAKHCGPGVTTHF